jgi:hypothetical protein
MLLRANFLLEEAIAVRTADPALPTDSAEITVVPASRAGSASPANQP